MLMAATKMDGCQIHDLAVPDSVDSVRHCKNKNLELIFLREGIDGKAKLKSFIFLD